MTTQDSYLFDDKNKNKKSGGGFARFCKFLFFVLAFFLVVITILANMGGSNDMLRDSVEKFVSDAFGKRPAQIGVLHKMSFFPSVGVHAQNIKVYSKPEEEGGYPVIKIGNLEAFMGFWSVATSNPTFKKLAIENVNVIKGMFVPEEFSMKHIFVDHIPGEKTAMLTGEGRVGVHDWSFNAKLNAYNTFAGKRYGFDEVTPFTLKIADMEIQGNFSKSGKEYFKFDDVIVTHGNRSASVSISFYSVSDGLLKIRGEIKDISSGTEIIPELLMNRKARPYQLSGDIIMKNFEIGSAAEKHSDVTAIISRLREVLGYDQANTPFDYMDIIEVDKDFDTTLKFVDASVKDQKLNFEMPYIQKNGQRRLGPVRAENATETLFPALIFVDVSEDTNAFMTMNGDVDTKFAEAVFASIPSYFQEQPKISVDCGVGVYTTQEDKITVTKAQILLADGMLSVHEQKLEDDNNYYDIVFGYAKKQVEVDVLSLPDMPYKFAKSQLLEASPNPTKCDDLISSVSDTKE